MWLVTWKFMRGWKVSLASIITDSMNGFKMVIKTTYSCCFSTPHIHIISARITSVFGLENSMMCSPGADSAFVKKNSTFFAFLLWYILPCVWWTLHLWPLLLLWVSTGTVKLIDLIVLMVTAVRKSQLAPAPLKMRQNQLCILLLRAYSSLLM